MPALEQLAHCLCAALAEHPELPELCFCGVVWGELVPADYVQDDKGMAWVRLISGQPSATFGQPYTEPGCTMPLAFVVEMGVLYCPPMPDSVDPRDLPSIADHLVAARHAATAMEAMFSAVICCFDSQDKDLVVGQYTPMGPQGGVMGGTLQLTVEGGVEWQE